MEYQWHLLYRTENALQEDIPLNSSKVHTLDGISICVFRTKFGVFALKNECPHKQLPLAGATCSDARTISCGFHQLLIDLPTGKVHSTRYEPVRTYPVQIRPDGVFVEL